MKHQQYLKNSVLELKNKKRYDTSLMIPGKFIDIVRKKSDFHGSFAKFLQFLITNHSVHLSYNSKLRQHVLTKYQNKGQGLIKYNFMPESRDWHALKSMANHLGVSASYLFVLLLKFELGVLKKLRGKLYLKPGIGVPVELLTFYNFLELKFGKHNEYLLNSRFKIG